ncbi:hypothetical protein OAG64_01075 [Akkermansiaceae bacterium]|nr:hypothetical protein [Akkermansiaceae bacterium]
MRVFAFYLSSGFEYRLFLHSGLYRMLEESGRCFVVRRPFHSKVARDLEEDYIIQELDDFENHTDANRSWWFDKYASSRRARNRLVGKGNFNYFTEDRSSGWGDLLRGNLYLNWLLRKMALRSLEKNFRNRQVESLFLDEGVTDLMVSNYQNVNALGVIHSALARGVRVWLCVNSWKDFFVNSFVGFRPSGIFVWSEKMKEQLLDSNPHLADVPILVVGSPAFDRHFKHTSRFDLKHFARKYQFDPRRPILLYSLLSPRAYPDEAKIISLIDKAVSEHWMTPHLRPIILLRRNPIDETIWRGSDNLEGNVRICEDYWDASFTRELFVQSEDGELEWLDLLAHATINLNVASTVTLESLAMGVPVINVEFGPDGLADQRLIRYSGAPFYLPLLGRNDVSIVRSIQQWVASVKRLLAKREILDFAEILAPYDGGATERVARELTRNV